MQLFDLEVSFSLCYHLSVGTGISALTARRSLLYLCYTASTTELRKLCSNLAPIKKLELRLK